jgi:hypothetical protein
MASTGSFDSVKVMTKNAHGGLAKPQRPAGKLQLEVMRRRREFPQDHAPTNDRNDEACQRQSHHLAGLRQRSGFPRGDKFPPHGPSSGRRVAAASAQERAYGARALGASRAFGRSDTMSGDFVIVERREDAPKVVSIPGRFSFADVRNARGERRVYGCHAVNPSIREIAIASPVAAKMSARVIAYIDHLGKLEGLVTRVLKRGFVMGVYAKGHDRHKLAAKIEWLQHHRNSEVHDQRADSRFVPKYPYSRMILSDGYTENCLILDRSVSGAALSAEAVPAIGTVLAIGKVISRVVRHFDEGFAVRFIEQQSRDTVEADLSDTNA